MEGQQGELPQNEISSENKSLARKTSTIIKNRVVNYLRNLNPFGKDKFWWMGNLLSTTGTAALFITAPPAIVAKSFASAALSVGTYVGEKAMERHRSNNWTDEQRAAYATQRQEKFPNGTSRLKRFLLGISAGGVYGAAIGIPYELATPEGFHPIKNAKQTLGLNK